MSPASPAGPERHPRRTGAAPAGARGAQRRNGSRDPDTRGLFKKTTLCRFYALKGGCERGGACPFAHGQDEIKSKPDLTKTSLCKLWARGRCPFESWQCPWAHGPHELQGIRTEAGELDPGDVALAECEFAGDCGSKAGSKGDGSKFCDFSDDKTSSTGMSTGPGDAVDILLDALAGGNGNPAGDKGARRRPGGPEGRKERPRFCVQCGASVHSNAASFCVQCGCALVECGQAPECAAQDGCPGGAPVAAPAELGGPVATTPCQWPMSPGTVVLVPAGWMAGGWPCIALGDASPASGVSGGWPCHFAPE